MVKQYAMQVLGLLPSLSAAACLLVMGRMLKECQEAACRAQVYRYGLWQVPTPTERASEWHQVGAATCSGPKRSSGVSEDKQLGFWVHYLAFQPWTKWLPFFLSQSLTVLNGNN